MSTEAEIGILLTKIITGFSILVSCPIYLLVLFVIFKNRRKEPFNSPFFTIFIALGLVDVVVYHVFNICKLAFLKIEWSALMPYNKPNTVGKIVIFINWWLAYMQFQLTILGCLNRVISIVWTGLYRQHWTPRLTLSLLFGSAFISMCLAAPILFIDVAVIQFSTIIDGILNVITMGPTFTNAVVTQAYMLSWKVHVYAILIVCTVSYTIMFIKVREIRAASKSSAMRREIRLLYPMTAIYVCNFLYVVFFALTDRWNASDAYDLNNGYVMMLTSTEVRHAVFQFVGIGCKTKTFPVMSVTNPH